LTGLPGIVALDLTLFLLGLLAWGTFKQRVWAWWGGLVYWGWLTVSTAVTFAATSYAALLGLLNLPAREIDFLDGVPLQAVHLAVFFGLIFALPLAWLVVCRRHLITSV
jgi:hypothetical protein